MVMVLAMLAGTASAQVSVTRIGTLGGSQSNALDINDNRQVVGQANMEGDEHAHGYIWQNGVITDLGSLGASYDSTAWAINNNGQAVGWSQRAGGNSAMMWHNGNATNINDLMGASNSLAWAINDNGAIVGQGNLAPGFAKGFVYEPGKGGIAAGTLPGYMGGSNRGINNSGTIVGDSFFFGDPSRAHRATPGGKGGYTSDPLGYDGYSFSIASAINNSGVTVGWSDTGKGGGWNAAIFTGDGKDPVISLGSLPDFATSEANAINDGGLIVGIAYDYMLDPLANPHAFAYFNDAMHDLNDYLPANSGFSVLLNATGVNNLGDIVGVGLTDEGYLAGFVLTGVPAPSSLALLGLGALVAGRRRR
jgi:probable HAF family extracellular repeat protein